MTMSIGCQQKEQGHIGEAKVRAKALWQALDGAHWTMGNAGQFKRKAVQLLWIPHLHLAQVDNVTECLLWSF